MEPDITSYDKGSDDLRS